jgi:DNA-binding HxlR family transcriptional regulator
MIRPDVEVLKALADVAAVDILARLVDSAATQRELCEELGITQSTASRRLSDLERLGVVAHHGGHGAPYELVWPDRVEQLIRAAADLAADGLGRRAAEADALARGYRKARFAGRPLHRGGEGQP